MRLLLIFKTIMQHITVLVALAGDANNIVPKSSVSVPEVLVLQACHGVDSVTAVDGTIHEARCGSVAEEYARLARIYGEGPVEICFGKSNFNTKIPRRFSEIEFDTGDQNDEDKDEEQVVRTQLSVKQRKAANSAIANLLGEAKSDPADQGEGGSEEKSSASDSFSTGDKGDSGTDTDSKKEG